jgi:hypothetical protein
MLLVRIPGGMPQGRAGWPIGDRDELDQSTACDVPRANIGVASTVAFVAGWNQLLL